MTEVSKVTLHVMDQPGSWVYLPSAVEVTYLPDTALNEETIKNAHRETTVLDPIKEIGTTTIVVESKQNCRYIKLKAKNFGTIPAGTPGTGNLAWLFADEIEVH